jgi:hypothetical protein
MQTLFRRSPFDMIKCPSNRVDKNVDDSLQSSTIKTESLFRKTKCKPWTRLKSIQPRWETPKSRKAQISLTWKPVVQWGQDESFCFTGCFKAEITVSTPRGKDPDVPDYHFKRSMLRNRKRPGSHTLYGVRNWRGANRSFKIFRGCRSNGLGLIFYLHHMTFYLIGTKNLCLFGCRPGQI